MLISQKLMTLDCIRSFYVFKARRIENLIDQISILANCVKKKQVMAIVYMHQSLKKVLLTKNYELPVYHTLCETTTPSKHYHK